MGKLIAFEGPEGAGKSTQIRHLATTVQSNGHSVLVTREPGGTPTGDAIRLVVLNPNLEINQSTFSQIAKYNYQLKANFLIVTNVLGTTLQNNDFLMKKLFLNKKLKFFFNDD